MSGYKIGCFPCMAWTLAVQIYFFCNSALQFKMTFICVARLSCSDSLIQIKCWLPKEQSRQPARPRQRARRRWTKRTIKKIKSRPARRAGVGCATMGARLFKVLGGDAEVERAVGGRIEQVFSCMQGRGGGDHEDVR